jgi:hypothetical protein
LDVDERKKKERERERQRGRERERERERERQKDRETERERERERESGPPAFRGTGRCLVRFSGSLRRRKKSKNVSSPSNVATEPNSEDS